eukprot:249425-Chlamydomonas_euryale.AAC.2
MQAGGRRPLRARTSSSRRCSCRSCSLAPASPSTVSWSPPRSPLSSGDGEDDGTPDGGAAFSRPAGSEKPPRPTLPRQRVGTEGHAARPLSRWRRASCGTRPAAEAADARGAQGPAGVQTHAHGDGKAGHVKGDAAASICVLSSCRKVRQTNQLKPTEVVAGAAALHPREHKAAPVCARRDALRARADAIRFRTNESAEDSACAPQSPATETNPSSGRELFATAGFCSLRQ